MSPIAQRVIDRLDLLRQSWWVFTFLSSAIWAMSVSLSLFLLFVLTDVFFRLPQALLAVGFGLWFLTTIALIFFVIRRVLLSQRSLEGTARCVESGYPELESHLINLVQLSQDTSNVDRGFCRAAVDQAAQRLGDFPFEQTAKKQTRFRRFLYSLQTPQDLIEACVVLLFLGVIAILGSSLFPTWTSAASRFTKPWDFVPTVGTVKIDVQPGNTEILIGSPLTITALTDEPVTKTPFTAKLFVRFEGSSQEEVYLMFAETTDLAKFDSKAITDEKSPPVKTDESQKADESDKSVSIKTDPAKKGSENELPKTSEVDERIERQYTATIPVVGKEAIYRVEVGDSQSARYMVRVIEKPAVSDVEVTYSYPQYMKRPSQTITMKTPDLAAPQYTSAELRVHSTIPVTSGRLEWDGGRATGEVQEDGRIIAAKIDLTRTMAFRIHLQKDSLEDPNPRLNQVRVEPDKAPSVEMLRPSSDVTAGIGQSIPIAVKLTDDFGISSAWIEAKIKKTGADELGQTSSGDSNGANSERSVEKDVTKIFRWPIDSSNNQAGQTQMELEHVLPISEDLVKPGQSVMIRVVAQDNRVYTNPSWGIDLKPQETAGSWRIIRTISKDDAVKDASAQLTSLRDSLRKLMEKQIRNQVRTASIPSKQTIDECAGIAAEDRTIQIELQKEAIRIVKSITNDARTEDMIIKRDLNKLAFGFMTKAIEETDALIKITTIPDFEEPVKSLNELQGKIVAELRRMTGMARSAEMKALNEMGFRSEDDLPDDVRKKMSALKQSLDEALEAQRKVVEAAKNLNKENVEDFSDEEDQLVKQLQAAEDAWEKFTNELNSDLSKLPFQDFANPSLLQEMVEIQTEIAKKNGDAGDLEKCADIAVPLEQLGTEMAEEVKTNMEKWLPDTADRERWSQEETVNDDEKEAPMTELPLELEDLIGELMEEEEDLFEEMEDVTSSMIDSLDAGAGWDAADGPISNNSAKGVTGNRLPNTNEIAGRSGEGRSGKAGGEFVGEEAVGKGGRNTPTRLTPDPYVKGQIKDHSRDAVGGATGGGKIGGETGEGLEGPQARNRGERERNRLPGKQADLRNRAEGVDLNHMNVKGYHSVELEKMQEIMSQVEIDLRGGRYQNAPRQRQILLDTAEDAKRHIGGRYIVKEDQTANISTNIQEQLISGSDDPSPAGWESVNKDYFRRLQEGSVEK
ncbi:MAG: hypothetical protein ACRCUY_06345 [Thermoguttaceae bacterium]